MCHGFPGALDEMRLKELLILSMKSAFMALRMRQADRLLPTNTSLFPKGPSAWHETPNARVDKAAQSET